MFNKNEEWRNIDGYEGMYQISNWGRVKSLNYMGGQKPKLLKLKMNKHGYLACSLSNNKKIKYFTTHRLVAKAFIPNICDKPQVNHKNGIKYENNVDNLEWCTNKENMNHAVLNDFIAKGETHGKSKLTTCQVQKIRENKECKPSLFWAKKYNVSTTTIRNIKYNRSRLGG